MSSIWDAFVTYVDHVLFITLCKCGKEDVKLFLYSLSILFGVNRASANLIRDQPDNVWRGIIAALCRYDPHTGTDGNAWELYSKSVAQLGVRHMLAMIMESKPGCSVRQLCFCISYMNFVVRESPVTLVGGSTLLDDRDSRSSLIEVGDDWTKLELPDVLLILLTALAQLLQGQVIGPEFLGDIREVEFGCVHVKWTEEIRVEWRHVVQQDKVRS
jgi:hypothetical protein